MPHNRTTFSKFIIEDQSRRGYSDPALAALLNDVQTACKFIASAISKGKLFTTALVPGASEDVAQKSIAAVANDMMMREHDAGGQVCAFSSAANPEPYTMPTSVQRGPYLLAFNALEGSSNIDIDLTSGTIFSILRAPQGSAAVIAEDFLQPGVRQVAAGFALYGATSAMVLTLGDGVYGFTLDREIGAYTLTHPGMRIAKDTRDIAVDASNQRHWEPPVRNYIEECIQGSSGSREADFNMRWTDSLAAETYRVLVRGGTVVYPLSPSSAKPGRLRLVHEANPIAMIVEQANGAASTGRERLLDRVPASLTERVPAIFGAQDEVARLGRYHQAYDKGEPFTFATPLLNARSIFRAS